MLTGVTLPVLESEFFEFLKLFFPNIYDVKNLMQKCGIYHGGLQSLATELDIERIGVQHQAGSDSLVTGMTFFKIKDVSFFHIISD